jgi:hypothetical protein
MDVDRLRRGELIAGVAGLALFIIMFFSWFGAPEIEGAPAGLDIEGIAEAAGVDTTFNAWQAFDLIDIILLITVIAAVGLAVASAMARTVSLPVAASAVTAGLGILSTLLIIYRLIDPPSDLDREFGVFLGLIAAAAITYGGWLSMQEEGTTFAGEADRLGDRLGGPDEPGPPPPPPPTSPPPPPPGSP